MRLCRRGGKSGNRPTIPVCCAQTATAARGPSPPARPIRDAARLRSYVAGTGDDATAALRDLDDRLRGVPKPDGTRLDAMRRRLRLAYVDGAEEWTAGNLGRRMTTDELGRVIGRF